uniref:Aprataxin and PNKP like factor n=1 Tax=Spermophilus dauricus TaxID=99837 RepID=A0A8C9QBW6_SPEDA
MSGGFELQPLDGGPRGDLAPGETVIGRGPLLGIHTNPCFYQSSEKSQPLPMKTNLWRWLNPGDSFSLLVDKYIFRVFATQLETDMECTLRNSQMLEEDNILNEAPKSPVTSLPDKTIGTSQLERSTELPKTQTTTTNSVSFLGECRDFSKQQSNPAQRKRVLPAWMLAENLSDQNLSASVISGGRFLFLLMLTLRKISNRFRKFF